MDHIITLIYYFYCQQSSILLFIKLLQSDNVAICTALEHIIIDLVFFLQYQENSLTKCEIILFGKITQNNKQNNEMAHEETFNLYYYGHYNSKYSS